MFPADAWSSWSFVNGKNVSVWVWSLQCPLANVHFKSSSYIAPSFPTPWNNVSHVSHAHVTWISGCFIHGSQPSQAVSTCQSVCPPLPGACPGCAEFGAWIGLCASLIKKIALDHIRSLYKSCKPQRGALFPLPLALGIDSPLQSWIGRAAVVASSNHIWTKNSWALMLQNSCGACKRSVILMTSYACGDISRPTCDMLVRRMSGRLTWRLVAWRSLSATAQDKTWKAIQRLCSREPYFMLAQVISMRLRCSCLHLHACYIAWMAGICCIVWLPRSWSKLIKAQLFSYSNCILFFFCVLFWLLLSKFFSLFPLSIIRSCCAASGSAQDHQPNLCKGLLRKLSSVCAFMPFWVLWCTKSCAFMWVWINTY